jgi:hypothetical protein
MGRKRDLTTRGVQKLTERERSVGLEQDDEAARWLGENDPKPQPVTPKSARKSKALHRWRQQNR